MSTARSNPASSTFFLLSIILLSFLGTTRADNPCPYPCYPPPTGTGTDTGTTPTTPTAPTAPTTPSGTTAPPAPPQSGLTYPPPSGNYPFNPTPPYGGGGGGDGNGGGVYGTPPPPDPILPYFPFYYRKPPHKPEDSSSSSAATMQKWTVMNMIATSTSLLSLLLLFV